MPLVIPNTIANGTPADGNLVGANFDAISAWAATAEATIADPYPTCKFVRTTDIVATTSSTTISGVSIEFASGLGWSDFWTSDNDFTIPDTGVYVITVEADWSKAPSAANYEAVLRLFLDGNDFVSVGSADVSDPSAFRYSNGVVMYLRAGEVVHLSHQLTSLSGSQNITLQEATVTFTKLVQLG